jgi:hypothetical protein
MLLLRVAARADARRKRQDSPSSYAGKFWKSVVLFSITQASLPKMAWPLGRYISFWGAGILLASA